MFWSWVHTKELTLTDLCLFSTTFASSCAKSDVLTNERAQSCGEMRSPFANCTHFHVIFPLPKGYQFPKRLWGNLRRIQASFQDEHGHGTNAVFLPGAISTCTQQCPAQDRFLRAGPWSHPCPSIFASTKAWLHFSFLLSDQLENFVLWRSGEEKCWSHCGFVFSNSFTGRRLRHQPTAERSSRCHQLLQQLPQPRCASQLEFHDFQSLSLFVWETDWASGSTVYPL